MAKDKHLRGLRDGAACVALKGYREESIVVGMQVFAKNLQLIRCLNNANQKKNINTHS